MADEARPVFWIKAARKDFDEFPAEARRDAADALAMASAGGKSAIAKPMHGLGPGVMEIALRRRGDAYRVVYALQLADAIWVVHAFQKKSKTGVKTPLPEIELIRSRLRRIKEGLV
jgi:phage-related protein